MPKTAEQISRERVAASAREQWWVRALLATEHDKLGAILRSAMNKQQDKEPRYLIWFGPKAIILDDSAPENAGISTDGSGVVWTNVQLPSELYSRTRPVCTLAEFVGALQALVDALQFKPWEAEALAHVLRAWIHSDERKNKGNRPEDRLPIDSIDKD